LVSDGKSAFTVRNVERYYDNMPAGRSLGAVAAAFTLHYGKVILPGIANSPSEFLFLPVN
jgi:hypothetical protein